MSFRIDVGVILNNEVQEKTYDFERKNSNMSSTNCCFYYDQAYPEDKDRVKRINIEHPGKMYYPIPEEL
jgi:hypothetical protein